MASAGTRAYNGGLVAEHPVGVKGAKPPETDEVFVFETFIFNAFAIV